MFAVALSTDASPHFPESYTIPSDAREACRVRELIADRLRQSGYAESDVVDILQALEEALVNAIKHGNKCDCRKRLRIAFCVGNDCFEVCVEDEGSGFDPKAVPNPIEAARLELPCGRGLLMMRHYMSEVRHLNPGNAVVMVKRRCG
jgi:serine/threonine-protein kinase RsbW